MNGTSEARANAGESLHAQAAGWYLRIREAQTEGTELSAEELLEWEQFFARPENRDAVDLAIDVSSHFLQRRHEISTPDPTADDGYDPSISVEEWLSQQRRKEAAPGRSRRLRFSTMAWSLAALVLLALAIGVSRNYLLRAPTSGTVKVLSTSTGEHKWLMLTDGSRITLGGHTEISVQYSAARRSIDILRGEAVFEVARDPARPFTVQAGTSVITALGTRFDVRRTLDRVTVTVTEGTVLVEPTDITGAALPTHNVRVPRARWRPVRLGQGQEVSYEDNLLRTASVEHADPSVTQWTEGRLQFRDVPLKYVVADVNRYRDQEIVLENSAVADFEFTGTVFRDRITEWAFSLERIFPGLQVRQEGSRITIQCRLPYASGAPCGTQ